MGDKFDREFWVSRLIIVVFVLIIMSLLNLYLKSCSKNKKENVMIAKQYTEFSPFKVIGGKGAEVDIIYLPGGKTYREIIDLGVRYEGCQDTRSSYWHMPFGRQNPDFMKIVTDPNLQDPPLFECDHTAAYEMDEAVKSFFKEEKWIHFGHSGSDATDTALRIADKIHPGGINVYLQNGFVGSNSAALALSGFKKEVPSFIDQKQFVELRLDELVEDHDGSGIEKIENLARVGKLSSVFIELVQGVGGAFVVPVEFIKRLQEIRQTYSTFVLVIDEVTSFGVVEQLLVSDYFGIKPDMITLGKGISGGYGDVSLVLATMEVYGAYCEAKGLHQFGRTTGGRPVHCKLVQQTLEEYQNWGQARLQAMSKQLDELISKHDLPSRGLGIFRAVDFGNSKRAEEVSIELLCKHKIYVRKEGRYLMLRPPLVAQDQEIERFCATVKKYV